jgi:MazG family protein
MNKKNISAAKLAASGELKALSAIMTKLLGPGGCPWDRRQTHRTLIKYLHEEAREVEQAVKRGDWGNLKEELGDVLLQVVFHSALAARDGRFTLSQVIRGINSKLVRRHPHVFGGAKLDTPAQVLAQWDLIKKAEKRVSARSSRRKA